MQLRDLKTRTPQQLWRGAKRRTKTRLFKAAQPLVSTVRSYYGPTLAIRPDDVTFIFCAAGTYGDFLSSHLAGITDEFVFLDIGANIGLFSILAAGNPHCVAAYAFEPVPMTYRYLVQNCELNDARKVSMFCAAVTDRPAHTISLAFNARHSGGAHLVEANGSGARVLASMAVGAAALSEILRPTRPTRIVAKIDVEGAEIGVLRALRDSGYLADIGDIFIEISEQIAGAEGAGKLKDELRALGFYEASRSSSRSDHYDAHYRRLPKAANALS